MGSTHRSSDKSNQISTPSIGCSSSVRMMMKKGFPYIRAKNSAQRQADSTARMSSSFSNFISKSKFRINSSKALSFQSETRRPKYVSSYKDFSKNIKDCGNINARPIRETLSPEELSDISLSSLPSSPARRITSTMVLCVLVFLAMLFSPAASQYTEAGAWEGVENNTAVNVSAQLATTAFLPCAVRMIGDKQISWIRKRDWHVLTSALQTFTNDARFSVTHKDGADDWTLTIKFLQKRDNGTYECQISTASGIVSQFVHLHVIVPEAFILGNSEYHVQKGSMINLFCIIEQSPIPPQFVSWYHNGRLLNYDKYRGGVSVHTDHGAKTSSRLIISGATATDSGNYTCGAPNTEAATVHVFVSQGDKTAAIQRRTSACSSLFSLQPPVVVVLGLLLLMHSTLVYSCSYITTHASSQGGFKTQRTSL